MAVRAIKGARLLRKLGLKTGDGVAVLAENHPDFLAVFWAAQISGLYFTPISVQFLTAEVRYIINDCEAKLLIVSQSQVAKAAGDTLALPHILLEDWLAAIDGESTMVPGAWSHPWIRAAATIRWSASWRSWSTCYPSGEPRTRPG